MRAAACRRRTPPGPARCGRWSTRRRRRWAGSTCYVHGPSAGFEPRPAGADGRGAVGRRARLDRQGLHVRGPGGVPSHARPGGVIVAVTDVAGIQPWPRVRRPLRGQGRPGPAGQVPGPRLGRRRRARLRGGAGAGADARGQSRAPARRRRWADGRRRTSPRPSATARGRFLHRPEPDRGRRQAAAMSRRFRPGRDVCLET